MPSGVEAISTSKRCAPVASSVGELDLSASSFSAIFALQWSRMARKVAPTSRIRSCRAVAMGVALRTSSRHSLVWRVWFSRRTSSMACRACSRIQRLSLPPLRHARRSCTMATVSAALVVSRFRTRSPRSVQKPSSRAPGVAPASRVAPPEPSTSCVAPRPRPPPPAALPPPQPAAARRRSDCCTCSRSSASYAASGLASTRAKSALSTGPVSISCTSSCELIRLRTSERTDRTCAGAS
mmetsp:Transcript_48605/g.136691  ORF Transcript_48605/g.136691 Transcript_48605/m.136691 type:complete len:239 (-) Transcript_48605:1261-1977(-)